MAGAAVHSDSLFSGLAGVLMLDEPLAPRTWIGVGGQADRFFQPADLEALRSLLQRGAELGLHVRVLGGGANLLVADEGVGGVVVSLESEAFRQTDIDVESGRARIAAGADLPRLVLHTAQQGLTGLDALAGVPGTIGGAARMNAGGKYGEIGAAITAVDFLHPDGSPQRFTRRDLQFDYRSTNLPNGVITHVEFEFGHDGPNEVHDRVKQIMAEKKRQQPLAEKSAGCVFKNPLVEGERVSAGMLIDQAGLKGAAVGRASVSERHANFLVTQPGCAASDILTLIARIRERVAEAHDVMLETELVIWRRDGEEEAKR
ncbi:MAG: UDP-N-acetylmuramate dehydrogenase [Phycisphaerales bacterium JB038]